jgi:hypothetical protein
MSFIYYILLGLFWILICIGLGMYINAIGFSKKNHHVIGLKGIFISYIVGILMLLAIIVFSL